MNWLNIIVASTNIAALAPIYASKHDLLTCFAIILAASASFVSHLFETHKHGMFGFNCLPKNSFLLNRIDVLGAIFLACRVLFIVKEEILLQHSFLILFFCAICMLSEYDQSAAKRNFFVVSHSIWHIGIFWVLYCLIEDNKIEYNLKNKQ